MQPFIQITESISLPLNKTFENRVQMSEEIFFDFARKNGLDVEVKATGFEEWPFRYVCDVNGITLLTLSKLKRRVEECPLCNGTSGLAGETRVKRFADCGMCEGSGKIYFN